MNRLGRSLSKFDIIGSVVEKKHMKVLTKMDLSPRLNLAYSLFGHAFDSPPVDYSLARRLAAADTRIFIKPAGPPSSLIQRGMSWALRLFAKKEPTTKKLVADTNPTAPSGDVAKRLAKAFQEHGVGYAIGGAHALNAWAQPRATEDVDMNIFIALSEAHSIIPLLKKLGAVTTYFVGRDEDAQHFIDDEFVDEHVYSGGENYMMVVIDGVKVELFPNTIELQEVIGERGVCTAPGDPELLFLSPEALIAVKLLFFRNKDRTDILNILRCCGAKINWDFLQELFVLVCKLQKPSGDYGGMTAQDWWPDIVAEYKARNSK